MNNQVPCNNPRDAIKGALRRDAARIQELPFDSALHHATMRRIRALSDDVPWRGHWWWKPVLAGAATACVGLAILVGHPLVSSKRPVRQESRVVQPGFDDTMALLHAAVARVSLEPERPAPAWSSPTASLLERPAFFCASLLSHRTVNTPNQKQL